MKNRRSFFRTLLAAPLVALGVATVKPPTQGLAAIKESLEGMDSALARLNRSFSEFEHAVANGKFDELAAEYRAWLRVPGVSHEEAIEAIKMSRAAARVCERVTAVEFSKSLRSTITVMRSVRPA